jgi:hypothetical protein
LNNLILFSSWKSVKKSEAKTINGHAIIEHSNKISLIVLRKHFDDFMMNHTDKKQSYGWIEDSLLVSPLSLLLKKHDPKNRAINNKIDRLIEHGITQRLMSDQYAKTMKMKSNLKEEEKVEVPEKLTMEHLELCFYAILIGLIISCVVFIVEVLSGIFSSR